MVCQPSGSLSTNSSQQASRPAAITSSSPAPRRPMRMFSMTVLLNSVTSWKTIEKSESNVSGAISATFSPPTVIRPVVASQKRAASLVAVVLPPPEGPTRAVTSP